MFVQEVSIEALNKITAHFHLRSRKIGKLSIIYLVVRFKGKQYKYSTGLHVYPEHWDRKRQRAVISSYFTEICNKHNNMINRELIVVWRQYEDWRLKISESATFRMLNLNSIKKMKQKIKNQNAVIQLIKLLNEQPMKDSSRYTYMQEIKSFEEFLGERGNKVIAWSDITLRLLSDYQKWIYTLKVPHKITGEIVYIEDNTAQSKFNHFCTLLTYAEKAEYIDLTSIKLDKLRKKKKRDQVQENQIFLTEQEICRIQSLSLQGIEDQARDLFIAQVESGQRYEDINGLNLGIEDCCTIATEKMGTIITFAMTPTLQLLKRKYNGQLPRISKAKTNQLLKKIGKQAGITRKHVAAEHRGGKLYRYEDEAWKFLGTHSARRSFITNNVTICNPQILKKITGHSTTSAFERYNRLSSQKACDVFMAAKQQQQQQERVIKQSTDNSENLIKEQKEVLMMLGANPLEIYDIDDADTLRRMLVHTEDILIQQLGLDDIKPFKDIFNEHIPIKERKQKIDLLQERAKTSKTCTLVESK